MTSSKQTGQFHRKAFFFDLDGTLAVHDQPPSADDAGAIRSLRRQGHLAFLCTGRAPTHIYDSIRAIGFDGIIAAAGCHILFDGRILYRRPLAPEFLEHIIAYYRKNGKLCVLEGEQSLYIVNPDNPHAGLSSKWPSIDQTDAFCPKTGKYAGQAVFKFTAFGADADENRRLFSPDMDIIEHPTHIEVLPAGCCKSDGIKRVLEAAGMDRADSIAFGDSNNDIDMLRYAGIGVAMGGSPETVIEAADRITGPLSESGVAQEIKRYLAEI